MHTCPECGQACYCGGDIDDCCFDGGDAQDCCTHYLVCQAKGDDWDDEEDDRDDEPDERRS